MHYRAEYLLQVLEKIGAPLMGAVIAANARAGGAVQIQNEAQKIAELLAKTVQASIDMSYALDLGPTGEMTDSIRVALTGLAGPLVAQYFESNSKAPGDAEIKRMITALQAVLSFAENFEANSENAGRLRDNEANGQAVDAVQYTVQYIHAFIPIIGAISAFPFGQQEQKLIMDASSRIAAKAKQMRESMFADAGPDSNRAELGILKALAEIYAACHGVETARIMAMDNDRRAQAGLTTDEVWKNFEVQAAMLEALARGIASGKKSSSAGSSGPKPAAAPPPVAPVQAVPVQYEPPVEAAAPPPSPPPPAPPPVAKPPATPPGQSGNPMAFFKGPPKDAA